MSCFVPGHVVIAAKRKDLETTLGMLREHTGRRIEMAYSITDVLHHYHLTDSSIELEKRMGPLPFVARVPDGEEIELASQFSQVPAIRCSFPDFLVRPTSANTEINVLAVEDALRAADLLPVDSTAGDSTKIAILDTGVDPDLLAKPGAMHPQQYDSQMRLYGSEAVDLGDAVGHGTLVAHIINRVSPAAELLSVKTMTDSGTIGSVLAGLYLAEAVFRPDIFNLSLSLRCDEEYCPICNSPQNSSINAAQVRLLFQSVANGRPDIGERPIFVAPAGNNRTSVSMPALFPRFIAVGAYDTRVNREADYSRHNAVPMDRYVLAPGGGQELSTALGRRTSGTWDRMPTFFGTSFAAAFVSGTIARCLSATWSGPPLVGRTSRPRILDRYQFAVDCLAESSDRSWPAYDPSRHGLGLLRWQDGVPTSVLNRGPGGHLRARKQLFVLVDTTGSMTDKLDAVADHVAALVPREKAGVVLRLVLYGDHEDVYTAYPYRVSESIEDIADAIRSAPRTEGGDVPEALEDALHLVSTEIQSMHLRDAEVVVFTDAPPHRPEECPHGYDFSEEVGRLTALDVRLSVVGCGDSPNGLGGEDSYATVEACRLSEHSWTI